MRVRSYGLLVLILAGVTPLCIYGMVAIERSRVTSIDQVRVGNERLARDIANGIREFMDQEKQLIATLGVALLETEPDRRQELIDSFTVQHVDFQAIAVFDRGRRLVAGRPPAGDEALYRDIAARILARVDGQGVDRQGGAGPATGETGAGARDGTEDDGGDGTEDGGGDGDEDGNRPALYEDGQWQLRPADDAFGQRALHSMLVGVPIEIAGAVEGVIVVPYALTRVWPAVEAVRVGETGFVRLLGPGGVLLAHGHIDERRRGFVAEPERNRALLADARGGRIAHNFRGQPIVASAAPIDDFGWWVVIEQTVQEAFAATNQMKRDLWIFAALVLAVMVVVGLLFGRVMVRGLERLRDHTQVLARGELAARTDARSPLVEVRALAVALNDMAAALAQMQEQGRARERLSMFARVAAGLAHDLRLPIEGVLGACEVFRAEPGDVQARDLLITVSGRELPRLKRYIDDMQRLAQQGQLALQHEQVDPLALARSAVEELSSAPKWSGVEFIARGDAAPATLDVALVRRAILNLAGNGADSCIKQAGHGVVTVDVSDRDDGDTLTIRVTDTGEGIADDLLATVLEANFVSTKRTNGFGLGLGVVRQVAAAHGGELTVSSSLGRGSAFELVIPRNTPGRVSESR